MINVIGGSGFVGSRLCKRFSQSNTAFCIVDKELSQVFNNKTVIADVRELSTLLDAVEDSPLGGGVIINLAAEHRDDVRPLSLYDEVNVLGAKNTCDLAREKNINKIIFTSSVAVYGFAPLGTGENGKINPFNDYGRTKYKAELVYKEWQAEDPDNRSLSIIRPTVIFGERNRGNVYNLLRQIASGKFIMIGDGKNRKSMAYVENVAAFLEFCLSFGAGVHTYNYIDKPDFDMNTLVSKCKKMLTGNGSIGCRLPFWFGLGVGRFFDFSAWVLGKKLPISSIRVKKFCVDSVYNTAIDDSGFKRPVVLEDALEKTLRFEFLEDNTSEPVYYSE